MKKLLSIGEALIDFIPQQTGCKVMEVETFAPKVGGAPANVAGAYTILGGDGRIITQLGNDPFGDKIVNELNGFGINTDYIARTDEANTALAFVSLMDDGNREFSFYRKPSADMLMKPEQIRKEWFEDAYALHFCSVSLGDFAMKDAHKQAIEYARENGCLISFDPNLRFPLWKSAEDLKSAVMEFLPMADVIKVSDEEIEFITGCGNIETALDKLFVGNVKLVIYTMGSDGAAAYKKDGTKAVIPGIKVKAADTTGAGDGFIGAFLYGMSHDDQTVEKLDGIDSDALGKYLTFANSFCAKSVQKLGAIASYEKMEL